MTFTTCHAVQSLTCFWCRMLHCYYQTNLLCMQGIIYRADSRFEPSQWETLLQSNAISHWLGANLESALIHDNAHSEVNNDSSSWVHSMPSGFGLDHHYPSIRTIYSAVLLWGAQFSPKSSQNTSHTSPVRARYGMYFVGLNCDSYPASVTAVMYAISCYIGMCYNGTELYVCIYIYIYIYWSGHKTVAVLLPGFAINW